MLMVDRKVSKGPALFAGPDVPFQSLPKFTLYKELHHFAVSATNSIDATNR